MSSALGVIGHRARIRHLNEPDSIPGVAHGHLRFHRARILCVRGIHRHFFGWYRLAGRPRSIRWMLFELKNRERHRRFTHYPAKHLKRGFDNPA